MKTKLNILKGILAGTALLTGLSLTGPFQARADTLIDCPASTTGDLTSRGFYVTSYPGTSIESVTVYMATSGASAPYQVAIDVTEGAFNGPAVASGFSSVTLDGTEKAVPIQMIHNSQVNPRVTPGSTLCFRFSINANPGAPAVYYGVNGAIGVDLPDSTDPCPNVVQTSGTAPPLSTFRREGVALQIRGDRFLDVYPGQTIQLAIDNADPGDTVTVQSGTYNEDLTLRDDVDVVGAGPGQTILQPSSGAGVSANGVEAEFSGFTIEPAPGSTATAGIDVVNSTVVLRNNHITGFPKYGMRVRNTGGLICGNRIEGNFDPSDGIPNDNFYLENGTPLVSNNLILDGERGCTVFGAASDGAQLVNNTVAGHSGEGMYFLASEASAKNNLVTGNSPGIRAASFGSTPVLSYNNVWGNFGAGNYTSDDTGVIHIGTGSISLDPLYDAAFPGDYLLSASSPCIDAGDPAAIFNDLDGSRNDIGYTGGPCSAAVPAGSLLHGFLWTSVGTIPVSEIDQTSGAKSGLTFSRDRPFGGSPWLYGPFGSETGLYRYAIKVGEWSGGTAPGSSDFVYIDDPLSKVHYSISGSTVIASNVSVGPITLGGKPSYRPTVNSGSGFWAHENLRMVLNTLRLDNGRYSVRIEALDIFGNPITLNPNPDLILLVNNTRPEASIDSVAFGGGTPFLECSIIDLPGETSTLNFTYTAGHADGFLDNYSLDVLVGRNRSGGNIVKDSYASHVSGTGLWNGVAAAPVAATPVSPEQALPNLQLWESCAYQFRITAWARTTNGFGRIYKKTFFDNYAIDLDGGSGGSGPDLDGDGDVDGDDLAIFAAAYGRE